MESFNKDNDCCSVFTKRFFLFFIIGTTIGAAFALLSMLQKEDVITEPEKEIAEKTVVDMVEVDLKMINGTFQVDKSSQKYYIDVT